MKKYLFILILLVSCEPIEIQGATYYVAPTTASPAGNNSNAGTTIDAPWRTLTYAFSMASPGDFIYLRGGTYTYAMLGQSLLVDNSGTAGNYIYVGAYADEKPVFDFRDYNFITHTRGIRMENCSYVILDGIEIKNMRQALDGASTNTGVYLANNVSHCIIREMNVHHIGGWAFQWSTNIDDIQFINCDGHHCSDPYSVRSKPYDASDGFQSASASATGIRFVGCRSYWNSDDGWDARFHDGDITWINCWAFWNGYRPGVFDTDADARVPVGNGEGFKLGTKHYPSTTETRRTMYGCLAFENYLLGFHHFIELGGAHYEFKCEIYNCISYNNGSGGGFNFGVQYTAEDVLRNNVNFGDARYINSSADHSYNSWNLGLTVSSADFVSISTTGMDGERNEDGSLPYLPFLRLHESSDLIDRGVDVGYSYNGSAPDLGAYESGEPIVIPPSDPDVSGLFRYHQGDTVWVFIKSGNKLLKKRE